MTTDEKRIKVLEWMGWKWYRHPSASSLKHPHYRFLAFPALHEFEQSPQWMVPADMTEKACSMEYMMKDFYLPPLTFDWVHECEKKLEKHTPTKHRYINNLWKILTNGEATGTADVFQEEMWVMIRATAEQRLDALVETIGEK